MDQYDDDEAGRARVLKNSQVLRFIARYWGRRPWRVAATIVVGLLAIAFETYMPTASSRLVDIASEGPKPGDDIWLAWFVFVLAYGSAGVIRNLGFMQFWNPLAARNMQEMTDEAFHRVQTFSSDWHADTFAGATVRRITRAMWGYDVVSDAVIGWIGPALIVLAVLSVNIMLRWFMIGAFSLVMVVAYIATTIAFSNYYVRKANLRSVALDSRIGGALADSLSSNPAVKGFGAEAREEARIGLVTNEWRDATLTTWNRYTVAWICQNLMMALTAAGLTALVLVQWRAGKASSGDVAFVITTFMIMGGYLRNMGDNVRMLQRGLADVEDVARYARMAPDVRDAPAAAPFLHGSGGIRFEDVTFRYKSVEKPLYRDFSLAIRPGERIALVGPTGSGKSTFVKLLQRLYDIQQGRILIDGQDIATVRQAELRRAIAVVPQDPALFHRSIAENIGYSRPDATLDEIVLAAKRARAHDFIATLPKGYDTLVGERGVKLSGGERQRVAIARAFLADAPILVLDEATSSLDVETEVKVQAATEELMAGRTTIVIAHRLSTIRSADRILVFDGGRIVEEGRHGDLVAKGGAYARLHAVTQGA
ncbi:MAG TPA: ABC transporter ATP-binding protein [Caulobacteraceae bacterium]|nr:ABC transporter ATP-binding protein [Caulobacteraceae bacterium]